MVTHPSSTTTSLLRTRLLWALLTLAGVAAATWAALTLANLTPMWSFAGIATWLAVLPAATIARPNRARTSRTDIAPHPLTSVRRRYTRLLALHADRIPLAGLDEDGRPALPLTSVYVEARVRPEAEPDAPTRAFADVARTRRGQRSFVWLLSRRKSRMALLVGGAGSGKTAALRRSALHLCDYRVGARRVPVLLELPRHVSEITSDAPPDLADLAAAAPWLHDETPAPWLRRRLRSGHCLVLVDGLDQIGVDDDREAVAEWLQEQAARYPNAGFVVACRDGNRPPKALAEVPRWQLRRFAHAQMSDFFEQWYLAADDSSEGRRRAAVESGVLMSRLHAHPGRFELASLPLSLTMMALVNQRCGFLPSSRQELHAEVCELLLHQDPTAAQGRRGAQKETVVRRIARHMMDRHLNELDAKTVGDMVTDTLREVWQQVTPSEFLDESVSNGLLHAENGRYSFSHAVLQEYFTALDFHERFGDAKLAAKIDQDWWRGVIVQWAAHTDPSRAVRACLQSGKVDALALAFDCARHARALDAEVRAQLDKLLRATSHDAEQNRLLGEVKVSRELRHTVELGRGRLLTAQPVSRDLYSSFLATEHPGTQAVDDDEFKDLPATGMWAEDASRFVDWVNSLPRHDDSVYRLPEAADLADPVCDLSGSAAGRSVWVGGAMRPRLYRTRGADNAFTLASGWWDQVALSDRRRGSLLLYLLTTVTDAKRHDLTRDLAGAMELNRERCYELPAQLSRDSELSDSRRALSRRDFSADDPDSATPIRRVIDRTARLAEDALDFRGEKATTAAETEPFTYLDKLTAKERRRLVTAQALTWLSWTPSQRKLGYGKALNEFDGHLLVNPLREYADDGATVRPERTWDSLCWLRSSFHRALPPATENSSPVHDLARELVIDVCEELTATLTHGASYDATSVNCARACLTAASAVVDAHARNQIKARPGTTEVLRHLGVTVAGLTVLERRVTGEIPPNEVILLVRD